MVFQLGNRRRRQPSKREQVIGVGAAIFALALGIIRNTRSGQPFWPGGIGSKIGLGVLWAVLALPVIGFLILRRIRREGDSEPRDGDMSDVSATSDNSSPDETSDEDDNSRRRVVLIAIAAALAAIGMGVFAFASTAHAQGVQDRGAFLILLGSDTVIADRFVRTADSLTGVVAMKNQPRVEYAMALGPNNTTQAIRIRVMKAGAAPGDPPLQSGSLTVHGDSAVLEGNGVSMRFAAPPDAVPSIANGFAISELFTRRARAHGNSGDYAYLAMNGKTLPVTVRPLGTDSMIVTLGQQAQRFRVDAIGRILGGSITGQPVDLVRATAEQTARISLGSTTLPATEKHDYSAPPGAPYTAEEVSFKGPGGITLGGTLTKPKNARGLLPAAVTITGSGQEDRDEFVPLAGGVRLFRQVADTLSRVGIAVLRLDDRGLGASTGDFAQSTTADFADDIRAGVAYLRSRGDIDGNRIALIGHSEGGIIAPMVAATDPKLRAIVTFGGPGDKMIEMSMAQNRWVVDHNPKLTPRERDSLMTYAREMLQPEKQTSPMLKFWMSYDPAPVARQVKAATLILQGETDRQVPVDNAGKLAALIRSNGNTDVTVRTFAYTDHLFLTDTTGDFLDMYKHVKGNQVSPRILGAMADWLVARLVGPPVVK